MSASLQSIVTLAAIAVSGAYLARSLWRSVRGRPGGLGNCCAKGCTAPAAAAPQIVSADSFAARAAHLAARRRQRPNA